MYKLPSKSYFGLVLIIFPKVSKAEAAVKTFIVEAVESPFLD
jgi:hypothetical protein